jgi:hypothetical protein
MIWSWPGVLYREPDSDQRGDCKWGLHSDREDRSQCQVCVVGCTAWFSGKIPADLARVDNEGPSFPEDTCPVGMAVHHEVEKAGFDEVGENVLLVSVKESYSFSFDGELKKIPFNPDVFCLRTPDLQKFMVSIVIPIHPDHIPIKAGKSGDYKGGDEVPGMEEHAAGRFPVQNGDSFFDSGDVVVGVPQKTDNHRDLLWIPEYVLILPAPEYLSAFLRRAGFPP